MSTFIFTCPFCEQKLDCPEEVHGKEIECPTCKELIVPFHEDESDNSLTNEAQKILNNESEQVCEQQNNIKSSLPEEHASLNNAQDVNNIAKTRKFSLYKGFSISSVFLSISIISLCCVILLKEYNLLPKKCISNEPQIYIDAQRDMLKVLQLLRQNFPKEKTYEEFEKMFARENMLDYFAQSYIVYAQQYLSCKGKCPHHFKKIETQMAAFTTVALMYLPWIRCKKHHSEFQQAVSSRFLKREYDLTSRWVKYAIEARRDAILQGNKSLNDMDEDVKAGKKLMIDLDELWQMVKVAEKSLDTAILAINNIEALKQQEKK